MARLRIQRGADLDQVLDEVAGHVREMHEKARTLFLVSAEHMKEADARPERKESADAWFEAAVAVRREAEALGALITRCRTSAVSGDVSKSN